MSKKLRSIEKQRTSTCLFADVVAECVLAKYHALKVPDAHVASTLAQSQTCVSALVMLENEELTVVSMGVGTRIVSEAVAREDAETGRVVLDSHAEVLARRAFIRFLYAQLELFRGSSTNCGEATSIFVASGDKARVRDGITFHLYCSSAPCGNACVRRWAKGETEQFQPQYSRFSWPNDASHQPPFLHPRLHAHHALQVAVLCKIAAAALVDAEDKETVGEKAEHAYDALEVPPGTAPSSDLAASSRATCSDKVARWCHLGLEGALFSSFLAEKEEEEGNVGGRAGIFPATVIVGRKFSRPHLERALCCRVQRKPKQHVAEPTVLCTAVKLQHGGLEENAKFCEYALVWSLDRSSNEANGLEFEILKDGLVLNKAAPSVVSRESLFALYLRASSKQQGMDMSTYSECKRRALSPTRLEAQHEFFRTMTAWPRYKFKLQ